MAKSPLLVDRIVLANGGVIETVAGTDIISIDSSGVVTLAGTTFTPVDLTTTGNTTLGNAASDTTAINGATTITTTSATGLTVGRLGATTPALKVDASASTVVTGLEIVGKAAAGGMVLRAISSGTNESMTLDAKGSGTVTINGTATGIVILPAGTTIGGSSVAALGVVTSTSANAVAVGPAGTTNPSFNVDASTASAATGINIKSAAAAGGVAVAVLSSGANENLTVDAKGSGTISIGSVSTGAIALARATGVTGPITGTSASSTALAVGLNGATNSSFVVDSSVGSQAAGLKVTGATAAGTVALAAISSGADAGLSIASKGDGNLSLNNAKGSHATKAAINGTATATAAEVASGYITSTSAAGTIITLPTGTDLGTALGASQGTVHELYIDNTAGANPVTIAVSVNGVLSTGAVDTAGSFGDLTVASGVTGLARYTIMFSSATAFAFTRTA